ncbi:MULTISPECIES: NAD(P)/FAD-dependent oxidoreductase [Heyndrickxia]|uniref:NAD(P)/FAD-dependent oxidoreductase n=1 Tax=Heyndrickxia faecalis TaxID=2824910 RepID=A0AAU7WD62_9BACI|nr:MULTISPECIES: NAD(P)/FAD-dependent oxidoreductase [Heyndrickxia]AVD56032.1 NAD(P)/FAD-dependent oxidoreductase [Heyndrickxia coagulans]MBQ4910779.1 NAD(P)/FAD-dependent oxidoreductase [Heyndrickxia faecalis]MEC2305440.1 NAD(P)/FAD-dependent oxidoreductase [Weizmannia sp. CD-2023]MEC2341535.1 NAD(P)/FAD-dependent oxidoreductase [Weizmannia sp. CD-2023]MED4891580.1 NAD(P)/FAD-dependent oxidoreductase [Weizmannia sp. CD-2023]
MLDADILIIGGGPAGISAAIWCNRLGMDHLLVEEHKMLGGQLSLIHNRIIDYPGLQAENGEEMRRYFVRHAESLQCRYRVNTRVVKIDAERKVAVVETGGLKTQIGFRYLIYAAGAVRRKLGVPGEKEMFARGEIYSATKDSHLFKGKSAAVIGGGDRAFEGACLLAEAGAHVYLIHRSERFRARQAYLSRAQSYKNIRILPNMRVKAIIGENQTEAVELIHSSGESCFLSVSAVFVRIGMEPNSALVQNVTGTDADGYIVSDGYGKTECEWLYAIGDNCLGPLYSSIAGAAGQGAAAAKHIASRLAEVPAR